ncbi:MAG TPA: hypothetical protein VKA15_23435 [Isosphaeraceae bacterium]|nr:hypothetical protein [Isosphaeraceae bacterium]
MQLLVNENVTGTVIRELRQRGHDVLSVKESMRCHSRPHPHATFAGCPIASRGGMSCSTW